MAPEGEISLALSLHRAKIWLADFLVKRAQNEDKGKFKSELDLPFRNMEIHSTTKEDVLYSRHQIYSTIRQNLTQ